QSFGSTESTGHVRSERRPVESEGRGHSAAFRRHRSIPKILSVPVGPHRRFVRAAIGLELGSGASTRAVLYSEHTFSEPCLRPGHASHWRRRRLREAEQEPAAPVLLFWRGRRRAKTRVSSRHRDAIHLFSRADWLEQSPSRLLGKSESGIFRSKLLVA